MMENRKKIGLLIIAVAVLILIIIIVMLMKKTDSDVSGPEATGTTGTLSPSSETVLTPTSTPGDKYRNPINYDITKEDAYKVGANDAAQMAKLFATRLGSFSNQSDYNNVTDLKIFMTSSMRDWADKYVAELKAQKYTGEYYGITTNPLTTKVLSYDEKTGKAKVEVITERREVKGITSGASYQQKMTVDLVKENNSWLVDNAVWDKK